MKCKRARDFCQGTRSCKEPLAEPEECFVELRSQLCAVTMCLAFGYLNLALYNTDLQSELVVKIAFTVNRQRIGVAVLCKTGHTQAR